MIVVRGSFRLPPDGRAEARQAMLQVIELTRDEPGCLAYSYAEDVSESGLFRVYEEWQDRAALDRHFTTPHMRQWQQVRNRLGFHDRHIETFMAGEPTTL